MTSSATPGALRKSPSQGTNMSAANGTTKDDTSGEKSADAANMADAPHTDPKMPVLQASTEVDTALVRKAMDFLSTATPGTLAGIAVGLGAVTYLILGKFSLLLIGAVSGVAGFVSWEAKNPEVARAVRGEKGLEIMERVWLDLKNARSLPTNNQEDVDEEDAQLRSFDDFRPETRDALGGFVDAVVRDYVKWWYSPIIPSDHSFPLACRKTFTAYLLAISNHLYRKRPADVYLDLLTNSSSIVIVFMSELAAAFAELPPDSNITAADTVYNYLASNPDSRLANLLNQRQQAAKFRTVAEDLLKFVEQNTFNCDPARVFMREILANSVLENTLQTCSKADWINGWIVYLLEAGEPDLSQAIDVGMQSGREAPTFADIDGNTGNVNVARTPRGTAEADRGRRKESMAHKKKLSKADEELEEAMEEMKRMNEMIAKDDARRKRDSDSMDGSEFVKQSIERNSEDLEKTRKSLAQSEFSPISGDSTDRYSPHGTSTDGISSTKSEVVQTPVTPRSTFDSSSPNSSPRQSGGPHFTSFDQIVPHGQKEDLDDELPKKSSLTLHNASFTLLDDTSGDKSRMRSKPAWDYLIQVEPSSASYPGWMIVRRYSDFETLHEILRRIATISGATAFTELHKELPSWKIHTRESLRGELERYLRDACWYQTLAESEGTKRFLEKSQGHTHGSSKGFGWDIVGKNMLDVLTIGPKGAMEGGRTLVGGVSGMFGNMNTAKRPSSQSVDLTPGSNRLSISTPPRMDQPARSPARSERGSLDSQRSSVVSTQPGKIAPMERRQSSQSQGDVGDDYFRRGRLERTESSISISASARPSREHSRASSLAAARSPSAASIDQSRLPPPPDEMPDDYTFPNGNDIHSPLQESIQMRGERRGSLTPLTPGSLSNGAINGTKKKTIRQYTQLSEPETRVAVELLFAIINEMYTLSSAWNIRRTLLAAAKSFLLRPGNPSLLTVQSLMQTSVLDANTSDAGIAAGLRKMRENTMPTDEERATWPPELTADEKEKLAVKARRLLIKSGVPAALMGVMGQAATGDALGRLFDCLQIEEVARGLIFGLMLQAVRIVTH